MIRELRFLRSGHLAWHERPAPSLVEPTDALVRPFIAGRCDGDTLPIHRPVSRALQAGMALGLVDRVVGSICGSVPFRGPFAIGHECVAEIVALGPEVRGLHSGQRVVVPWAVSCGTCLPCRRGLTAKCADANGTLAGYGFGPACGPWGRHGHGRVPRPARRPHARPRTARRPGRTCGRGERQPRRRVACGRPWPGGTPWRQSAGARWWREEHRLVRRRTRRRPRRHHRLSRRRPRAVHDRRIPWRTTERVTTVTADWASAATPTPDTIPPELHDYFGGTT